MTKQQILKQLLEDLAELTNGATSKQEAQSKNLMTFLHIDYAPTYGGYRLVGVMVDSGGHTGTILGSASSERQNFKTFRLMLESCIAGLNFNTAV